MKKNVRLGVFETNSSSEHAFAVINLDKFRKWKNGELVGRVIGTQEAKNCWGNFWSEMLSLEFTDDLQKAKLENESMFKSNIAKCLEKNELYKQRCLEYVPKLQRQLTKEELAALSPEEEQQYYDDEYMDKMHKFDESEYNKEKEMLESMKFEDFDEHFGKVECGLWCTFEEFWDSWIKNNDCYSPFEHDDTTNNVHIIGKYYHS